MEEYTYQHGFSQMHREAMYDTGGRELKAKKMLAVLKDHYSGGLKDLSLLDIGSSTGIIASVLSGSVREVLGVDIDEKAVEHAKKNFSGDNLGFKVQDSMNLEFADNMFDVVICSQVYEHVPDSKRLMSEIHRVLKPGGVCFFSGGNRIKLIEHHYKLPLLSVIPKPLAHLYLRVLNKGKFYYENHLTLWGLRKLVSEFDIIDYTLKVIQDPVKYCATDMVQAGSRKQKIAAWVLRKAYWICPNYIWLLRK